MTATTEHIILSASFTSHSKSVRWYRHLHGRASHKRYSLYCWRARNSSYKPVLHRNQTQAAGLTDRHSMSYSTAPHTYQLTSTEFYNMIKRRPLQWSSMIFLSVSHVYMVTGDITVWARFHTSDDIKYCYWLWPVWMQLKSLVQSHQPDEAQYFPEPGVSRFFCHSRHSSSVWNSIRSGMRAFGSARISWCFFQLLLCGT